MATPPIKETTPSGLTAKADRIMLLLGQTWPNAHCELEYQTIFQLLVATILSAQTTDLKVNRVTRTLFERYPTAETLTLCPLPELEEILRPLGLFRAKAKNLLALCHILITEHGGHVPSERPVLTSLPGVGRKTANVVLMEGFRVPALPVDTHVLRLANRLGLSSNRNPIQVEKDLTSLIPETEWREAHHRLIWHGRRVCRARKPACGLCRLISLCAFGAISEPAPVSVSQTGSPSEPSSPGKSFPQK